MKEVIDSINNKIKLLKEDTQGLEEDVKTLVFMFHGKYLSELLWYLDDGETYRLFEKKQFNKFKKSGKNSFVKLSKMGTWQFKDKRNGKVVGFGKDKRTIRVLKEGTKTPSSYWVGFWELRKYQNNK